MKGIQPLLLHPQKIGPIGGELLVSDVLGNGVPELSYEIFVFEDGLGSDEER